MVYVTSDRLSRLEAAARLGVNVQTLDRWRKVGLRGVRLAPSFVGGRIFYTIQAIEEFQREVDRRRQPEPAISARRRKEIAAAGEYCRRVLYGRRKRGVNENAGTVQG